MTPAGGEGDGREDGVFFKAAVEKFLKRDFTLDFALRVVFLLAAIVAESEKYGAE